MIKLFDSDSNESKRQKHLYIPNINDDIFYSYSLLDNTITQTLYSRSWKLFHSIWLSLLIFPFYLRFSNVIKFRHYLVSWLPFIFQCRDFPSFSRVKLYKPEKNFRLCKYSRLNSCCLPNVIFSFEDDDCNHTVNTEPFLNTNKRKWRNCFGTLMLNKAG